MKRGRLAVAAALALLVPSCNRSETVCAPRLSFDPSTGAPLDGGDHFHPASPTPERYRSYRNPYPYDDPSLSSLGRPIYSSRCARCHGDDGLGCGPEANLHAPPPADLRAANYGHDDPYLFWRIHDGGDLPGTRTAMPAFRDELTDAEIWQALTYLRRQFVY